MKNCLTRLIFIFVILAISQLSYGSPSARCTSEFKNKTQILSELVSLKVEIENLTGRAQTGDGMARSMALVLSRDFNEKFRSAFSASIFSDSEFQRALDRARQASSANQSENLAKENLERRSLLIYDPALTLDRKDQGLTGVTISQDGSKIILKFYAPPRIELVDSKLGTGIKTIFLSSNLEFSKATPLPNSNRLVLSDSHAGIFEYDLNAEEVVWDTQTALAENNLVQASERNTFVQRYLDRRIFLWDLNTKTKIQTFFDPKTTEGEIQTLAISSDGEWIASSQGDTLTTSKEESQITVWTPQKSKPVFKLLGHKSAVTQIVILPLEQKLVSADLSGTIITWSLIQKKEIGRISVPTSGEGFHSLSPDGKVVALTTTNELITFSAETGVEIQRFHIPSAPFSVSFSRDSKNILLTTDSSVFTFRRLEL